jgi:hypothetical protein
MDDSPEFSENMPEYSGFSLLLAILCLVVTFSIFPLISGHIVRMVSKLDFRLNGSYFADGNV